MMETTEKPKVNVAAQMRQTAVSAAISGALMLFFGYRGIVTSSDAYDRFADVFLWTLRIGGIAMAVSAVVCFLQLRSALLYDAVAAGLVGLLLIGEGAGMIAISGSADLMDVLLLLFGAMFVRSAWISWTSYRDGVLLGHAVVPEEEPPHEEETSGSSQSKDQGRPGSDRESTTSEEKHLEGDPPPKGFLADLGKNGK